MKARLGVIVMVRVRVMAMVVTVRVAVMLLISNKREQKIASSSIGVDTNVKSQLTELTQ